MESCHERASMAVFVQARLQLLVHAAVWYFQGERSSPVILLCSWLSEASWETTHTDECFSKVAISFSLSGAHQAHEMVLVRTLCVCITLESQVPPR